MVTLKRFHGLACCLFVLSAAAAAVAAPPPDMPDHAGVTVENYPDADAVVLQHDMFWTIDADGSVTLRDHQWIKMLSSRAIRRIADPRIRFREGRDTVDITIARTHTPDGKTVDAPEYARNLVSPRGAADMPAFADLREWVVSLSGVQEGAVYELEYVKKTVAGADQWVWADIRLADDDPVIECHVRVALPADTSFAYEVSGVSEQGTRSKDGNTAIHEWTFRDLPACPNERSSPNWQRRCPRLRFTTAPDVTAWGGELLDRIADAADADDTIVALTKDAVDEQPDDEARIRAVCDKIKETVNTVGGLDGWSGRHPRKAADVLASRYASNTEAATLCVAMLKSAGFDAAPAVTVDARSTSESAAVDDDARDFLAAVVFPAKRVFVHPTQGIVQDNGDATQMRVLTRNTQRGVRFDPLVQRAAVQAGVNANLNLKLEDDGALTGRISVELSGSFADPDRLRTEDEKKRAVSSVASDLIEGLKVDNVSVSEFAPGAFKATATVEGKDIVAAHGPLRTLTLAEPSPALERLHFPFDAEPRRTPLDLHEPTLENVNITIDFPKTWVIDIKPTNLNRVPPLAAGPMRVEQFVTIKDQRITIQRTIKLPGELSANDYAMMRDAFNTLRAAGWRQFVFRPKKK